MSNRRPPRVPIATFLRHLTVVAGLIAVWAALV